MYKLQVNTKLLRAAKNMTQEELASLVGVSRKTIVYLEQGTYNPSYLLVWNIAKVFGCQVEQVAKFIKQ